MRTILNFQSEQEFQDFFGQLCSAEIPDFLPIEGAGGDKGFDGLSGTTAYQVYFPLEKNRKDSNYKNKIDTDLQKVIDNKDKLEIVVEKWILVIPEDLRIEVVAHLKKKSSETGIQCTYWGATKLTELVNKYPYIKDAFPTMFLPPVRKGLQDLTDTITQGQRPRVMTSVEIITDDEFLINRKQIQEEYRQKTESFMRTHGTASSAYLQADMIYKQEADKKIIDLQLKKERSDRAYQLELEEINDYWDSEVKKIKEDMARRNIYNSGIMHKALGEAEVRRNRDIAKLNLKFGKKGK